MSLLETARSYLGAGLCALPANLAGKYPALSAWKKYQQKPPEREELASLWGRADALCLLTGAASGNLHLLDFDSKAELFGPWAEIVGEQSPGLLEKLVMERSQGGGVHAVYRVEGPVGGNTKLASRTIEVAGKDPVVLHGKEYRPREVKGRWVIVPTLIETRGEGGLFLCAPSPGYELFQGELGSVQTLTAEEHEVLISAARSLHEPDEAIEVSFAPQGGGQRPGDEYSERGDIRGLLGRHGWTQVSSGENELWRRPGKSHAWSASLKDRVFYCFTSNAAPLEPEKAYSPFSLYATLEHGGDFRRAAAQLRSEGYGSDGPGEVPSEDPSAREAGYVPPTLNTLVATHPEMRRPVIAELLREGESLNLIAAPKVGKSWLSASLALSTTVGGAWLQRFQCAQGRVLLIDNELHAETSAHRLPKVADAMGVDLAVAGELLHVENCRGQHLTINNLSRLLSGMQYRMVVLDAFYRFLPEGTDENDNGAMTGVYGRIDRVAKEYGCAIVLVHHTSKGAQGHKSVTDVGAGAGAQSRAADTHVILRRHQVQDAVVFDVAARSWPPVKPFCMRWGYPIWVPAPELDPADLESPYTKRRREKTESSEPVVPDWTPESFAEAFLNAEPQDREEILMAANDQGLSDHKAGKLLKRALRMKHAHRWKLDGNASGYSSEPQPDPELELGSDEDAPKAAKVISLLNQFPDMSRRAIARQCEVTHTYVNDLARRLEDGGGK